VWVARLGGQAGLIARVGNDVLGQALVRDLQQEGVQAHIVLGEETTGLLVVLDDRSDDRTIVVARGASSRLSGDDLDFSILDRADLLHVTAFSFLEEAPRSAALSAMAQVKARGKLVSLDPSAHGYVQRVGAAAFLDMIKDADILFPNLEEGQALTGERQPAEVVRALVRRFPVVALKLGAQGALAGAGDTAAHHPGWDVPVVDTTGAGDAFAAAFVVSWLADHDLAAALEQGNRVAAGVVQVAGARRSTAMPRGSSPQR
jgi:ribokinase